VEDGSLEKCTCVQLELHSLFVYVEIVEKIIRQQPNADAAAISQTAPSAIGEID
jgi:hypothetical protein